MIDLNDIYLQHRTPDHHNLFVWIQSYLKKRPSAGYSICMHTTLLLWDHIFKKNNDSMLICKLFDLFLFFIIFFWLYAWASETTHILIICPWVMSSIILRMIKHFFKDDLNLKRGEIENIRFLWMKLIA